jgi:hypothetical protein
MRLDRPSSPLVRAKARTRYLALDSRFRGNERKMRQSLRIGL